MHQIFIFSDGGKNKEQGPYGSFAVVYRNDEQRRQEFEYNESYTAPDTEAATLSNALLYAKSLKSRCALDLRFSFMIDADWLYGHVTMPGRKIAKKHQSIVRKIKNMVEELDATLILISGEEMKARLGH